MYWSLALIEGRNENITRHKYCLETIKRVCDTLLNNNNNYTVLPHYNSDL